MKASKGNRFQDFESVNCGACGNEYMRIDLSSIKLSGFESIINICISCKSKSPQDQYKTAASILNDIVSIANISDTSSVEERLARIKELLK